MKTTFLGFFIHSFKWVAATSQRAASSIGEMMLLNVLPKDTAMLVRSGPPAFQSLSNALYLLNHSLPKALARQIQTQSQACTAQEEAQQLPCRFSVCMFAWDTIHLFLTTFFFFGRGSLILVNR